MHSPASRTPPPPVILVHGFKDTARRMRHIAKHLAQEGRSCHSCTLSPSWGQAGLDILALQLSQFIDAEVPTTPKVDLVAFSMGGLISRYYLQRLGGLAKVRRFVTLATPHHGTHWARLFRSPGCQQMRPGSPFLRDLKNDEEALTAVGFTSIWTPMDAVIIPSNSSIVTCAENRKVNALAHPLMVRDPRILRVISEVIC